MKKNMKFIDLKSFISTVLVFSMIFSTTFTSFPRAAYAEGEKDVLYFLIFRNIDASHVTPSLCAVPIITKNGKATAEDISHIVSEINYNKSFNNFERGIDFLVNEGLCKDILYYDTEHKNPFLISKDTKHTTSERLETASHLLQDTFLNEDLQKIRTDLVKISPAEDAGLTAFTVAAGEVILVAAVLGGATSISIEIPGIGGYLALIGLALIPIVLISGSVYMFASAQKRELMEKYEFLYDKLEAGKGLSQSIQIQQEESNRFSNCLGVECLQPEKSESGNSYKMFSFISILKDIFNTAENSLGTKKEIYTYSESEFDVVFQQLNSNAFAGRFALDLDSSK